MAKLKARQVSAIIQARMGSTRLPGKMLLPIVDNKGALELMLERVRLARQLQKIVVATTTSPSDDRLVDLCKRLGYEYFRGDENDVLERYYQAALAFGPAEVIVRLTGDCPLHDPDVIDLVVGEYLKGNCDYVSNTQKYTFPDGLDVEVFSFSVLERARREANLKSEREHVTPYIRKHADVFKTATVECEKDLSGHRWTLDEKEDYEFIKHIYKNLYKKNPAFGMEDILELLARHPELEAINKHISRNEGYQKSLKEDKILDSGDRKRS
jgi:spore coat polysaccharide biosynthesis protein SpsF (cytidylyltransferase family)